MSQSLGAGLDQSLVATATLATKQYYGVLADTANDGQVIIATANSQLLGVLQNAPAAGEIALVRSVRGLTTKAIAGGTITRGDRIQVTTGAVFITGTGAAQIICGIAMASAVTNDIFEMQLVDGYVA